MMEKYSTGIIFGIIIFVIIFVIMTLKYCPYFSSYFGSGPVIFNPDDKLTPFNFDNKYEPIYVK